KCNEIYKKLENIYTEKFPLLSKLEDVNSLKLLLTQIYTLNKDSSWQKASSRQTVNSFTPVVLDQLEFREAAFRYGEIMKKNPDKADHELEQRKQKIKDILDKCHVRYIGSLT